MKTNAIALLAITVGLAVGVASAQLPEPLTFRTPFAFAVGDRVLPAGEYIVRASSTPMMILSFTSADGKANAFIRSIPVQKAETETRTSLVFHRYGVHYYISEIWTPGESIGRTMMRGSSELEFEKSSAPQHVILYAGAR